MIHKWKKGNHSGKYKTTHQDLWDKDDVVGWAYLISPSSENTENLIKILKDMFEDMRESLEEKYGSLFKENNVSTTVGASFPLESIPVVAFLKRWCQFL